MYYPFYVLFTLREEREGTRYNICWTTKTLCNKGYPTKKLAVNKVILKRLSMNKGDMHTKA